MSPAIFIKLERMPLTPNGKVDRKALPDIVVGAEENGEVRLTAVGEILGGIWADLLKLAQVGERENFFELGGHSLLATQVVSRIRNVFEIETPLRTLFENPTLVSFVEAVERELRAGRLIEAPPIRSVDRS